MTNSELLVQAGKTYQFKQHKGGPGVRCFRGSKPHKFLQQMALRQAKYQAKYITQGHQNWDDRFEECRRHLPAGFMVAENAAESWPENSRIEAATEMFYCWERSPGHWGLCQHKGAAYYGINMSKGRNGVYYATLLVAWKQ